MQDTRLKKYKQEVWHLMHRDTDHPDTQTVALRLYLDESGGEDPGTPHSVIGGLLIYKDAFQLFEDRWDQMLQHHGITGGLHMKEFGRPHGRLAGISDCCRKKLFDEACYLIRRYRAMSVATSLSNDEYHTHVPEVVQKMYSVYAMGFSLMVMMNHKLAEFNKYSDPVPIIMDSGNPKSGQISQIHGWMQKRFQKDHYLHLGSLTFDDDKVWGILQAADLIAWGVRRKASGISFEHGFSPISDLLSEQAHHAHEPWKQEWLAEFGSDLAQAIAAEQEIEGSTNEI